MGTVIANFLREQHKERRPTQALCYNLIGSAYREGTNSILRKLPMSEVNILHGCTHVPANQSVNHLLAFSKDVHFHRVEFDKDWLE